MSSSATSIGSDLIRRPELADSPSCLSQIVTAGGTVGPDHLLRSNDPRKRPPFSGHSFAQEQKPLHERRGAGRAALDVHIHGEEGVYPWTTL